MTHYGEDHGIEPSPHEEVRACAQHTAHAPEAQEVAPKGKITQKSERHPILTLKGLPGNYQFSSIRAVCFSTSTPWRLHTYWKA
jgi:hypothetical protein